MHLLSPSRGAPERRRRPGPQLPLGIEGVRYGDLHEPARARGAGRALSRGAGRAGSGAGGTLRGVSRRARAAPARGIGAADRSRAPAVAFVARLFRVEAGRQALLDFGDARAGGLPPEGVRGAARGQEVPGGQLPADAPALRARSRAVRRPCPSWRAGRRRADAVARCWTRCSRSETAGARRCASWICSSAGPPFIGSTPGRTPRSPAGCRFTFRTTSTTSTWCRCAGPTPSCRTSPKGCPSTGGAATASR